MTVSNSTNKIIGSGNGVTTSWPFSFKVFDPAHLVVTFTDAVGAETTLQSGDYAVSLNVDQDSSPGGTVTYSPAIASGTKLTILRSVPVTQAIDLKNQGGFFPEVLERGLDLVVMQVQALREQLARTVKLSASQSAIGELQASDANRANTLLGFDAQGMLTAVAGGASAAVSLAMQPVVGAASLPAARTAMGLGGLATLNADPAALPKAGGSMTGALNQAKGANLASAAGTTNIWTQTDGDLIHITGTNLITSFGTAPQAGAVRRIVADGAFGLAQGANLDLPFGGASITVAVGDRFTVIANTTTAMIITDYVKADGTPLRMGNTGTRQTVQAGPLDTAGLPSFLPATSGNLNLTSQNISTSAPFVVSSANNAGANGPNDRIGIALSNLTWTGLTANRAAATPNFLYVTVSANGALTTGFTTVAPLYQWGGTPATTNGLFTFNIAEMRGYLGNGTTAPQAHVVFVGEAATDGSGVIGTVGYAFNGRYDSGWTATLPGVAGGYALKNSNLGIHADQVALIIECTSADGGYSVGDRLHRTSEHDGSGTYQASISTTRNTVGFNYGTWVSHNKGTAVGFNPAVAKWQWKVVASRGWY